MKRFLGKLLIGSFALAAAGCGPSTGSPAGDQLGTLAARHRQPARWTVLVHMAADNDLHAPDLSDLN